MKVDNMSLIGSNAVMSATMTCLKRGTCIGLQPCEADGIYFGLPLENEINRSYDSPYVRDLSAFGVYGDPDSVKEIKKNNLIIDYLLIGSNAVMSSTITGLKSSTYIDLLGYDFSVGIYFSLPLENDLNRLYDIKYVRDLSAFGACGDPDSVYKSNKENKTICK